MKLERMIAIVMLLLQREKMSAMLEYNTMEDITETADGRLTVSFQFIDDEYGYGILMSFGHRLACLEPEFVRAELKKRLTATLRLYD